MGNAIQRVGRSRDPLSPAQAQNGEKGRYLWTSHCKYPEYSRPSVFAMAELKCRNRENGKTEVEKRLFRD